MKRKEAEGKQKKAHAHRPPTDAMTSFVRDVTLSYFKLT